MSSALFQSLLILAVIIGFLSTIKIPITLWERTKQQIKVNNRELGTRVTGDIAILLSCSKPHRIFEQWNFAFCKIKESE